MKHGFATAFFCLFALTASAGTITSINPSSIPVSSAEHFLTVYGTDLGDRIIFDGPAGRHEVEVTAAFYGSVVGWIPEAVVNTAGTYSVTVVGPNGESNPATFKVRGYIYTPLILLLPEYLRVQPLSREGVYVKYEVFAMGGDDEEPRVSCSPESGSFFKMGQTVVTCTATNRYDERAEDSFIVTVRDEEAPILEVPREPIVVRAESIEGAIVEYKTIANDDIYGELETDCLPRSGSMFPIGITTVQCSATDLDLNVGYGSFDVEVRGEREPYTLIVEVPEEVVVEAKSAEGTEVHYDVRVSGTEDERPLITCEPKSGSHFRIGDTAVTCNAIDAWGMRGSASFPVRVLDTNYPSILELYTKPDSLVADGALHPVEVLVHAVDEIDLAPTCEVYAVTANEPIDVGDDGDPDVYDWRIHGPLSLELRAERFGEQRVYTLWVACSDFFGNRTIAATDVVVHGGRAAKANVTTGSGKRRSTRSR